LNVSTPVGNTRRRKRLSSLSQTSVPCFDPPDPVAEARPLGRPEPPFIFEGLAQATARQDALAGQPPRFIRRHEGDDIGDVLGLTQAPERGLGDDAGLEL
jgi:hypothetical protein